MVISKVMRCSRNGNASKVGCRTIEGSLLGYCFNYWRSNVVSNRAIERYALQRNRAAESGYFLISGVGVEQHEIIRSRKKTDKLRFHF